MRRWDVIDAAERRYKSNIRNSRYFQLASNEFNREGMDLELRARNRAVGINNFARMYQDAYPRSVYMGVRNAQGSGR